MPGQFVRVEFGNFICAFAHFHICTFNTTMAPKSAIIPPNLKKGDLVGIVCPAGFMPVDKVSECVRVLFEVWGLHAKVGKTVGSKYNYFSGSDEDRLADLQEMLDDPTVKAILCGRGGYGTGRIIDKINFRKFVKHPKWIIGFSDITILHSHILSRYNIASIHGPMANAFNKDGYLNEYVRSLRKAITGKKATYTTSCHPFNQPGKASGQLVGGNLSLVAHLTGTPSDINTKGRILFLEDVGEYLYNIDRMLYQLKRSGKLAGLAGLILGGFTDNKDTETPFGKTAEEIIHDMVKEYRFPVCYGFPVSHEKENVALKVGGMYSLSVTHKKVSLKEI
jgi:muramoyltetrapeptide carboxypeptidase